MIRNSSSKGIQMRIPSTKPLPKWVMQRYADLWQRFAEKEFEHAQLLKTLDAGIASVIVLHLRKNGWITISLHPEDMRKRLYRLKSPEQAISDMALGGRVAPRDRVIVGEGVALGDREVVGDGVALGDREVIGDGAVRGDGGVIEEGVVRKVTKAKHTARSKRGGKR